MHTDVFQISSKTHQTVQEKLTNLSLNSELLQWWLTSIFCLDASAGTLKRNIGEGGFESFVVIWPSFVLCGMPDPWVRMTSCVWFCWMGSSCSWLMICGLPQLFILLWSLVNLSHPHGFLRIPYNLIEIIFFLLSGWSWSSSKLLWAKDRQTHAHTQISVSFKRFGFLGSNAEMPFSMRLNHRITEL